MNIFSKDSHILHSSPLPDSGMPPNNTAGNASMFLDPDSSHYCAARKPNTRLNNAARTDSNIRSNETSLTNFGCFVHNNVPHNVRSTGQLRRRLLPQ
ncbi:hypothetical protein MtrunA17_Chr5g0435781 [Medicago truncatula]|uniref:Uncharacterized protein n=1 Tax=Medicago truncatula TaxID=3880 RepID=I3S3K8_MEDTR|nr:unknown [Medicago truncatula]RHN57017.1 hypothetical protein MtrunA17_Chr5g0435781 [Medicago truncatula]